MANKDKLLESAQKFLAKGQLPKAIGEYQKLIEAFPKDFRNRQKLAELLSREKRNEEAQPHYEAVARNFAETGFYLKAIAIYKQMQKIEPGRVDIYLRLAELNEKQGLIGNALNEYRTLIAFYDKNRMGREAIGVLQKMIALDPENLGFRGKLIEIFVASGEEAEALEQLRTVVKFLAAKGEHAKVVKLYEKFIDLCPEEADVRLPLIEALLASEQPEKALPFARNLLKSAPDHPLLLKLLTDCHLAVGNYADARLACQHLLKEHPQDLALRERLVRICMAEGEHARALECLEEAKELFSQAGRVAVLKELYEALQPALPGDARLQATLAAIYEATGEDGSPPVALNTGVTAVVVEETADAAVLDAAIGDVEHLDLVGDTPSSAVAVPELELDLDLDLGGPVAGPSVEPPVVAAVADTPVAPMLQPAEPEPVPALELELDLGGLESLELEPSLAETAPVVARPVEEAVDSELSLEIELDLEGLDALEMEAPSESEPGAVAPPVESFPSAPVPEVELTRETVAETDLEAASPDRSFELDTSAVFASVSESESIELPGDEYFPEEVATTGEATEQVDVEPPGGTDVPRNLEDIEAVDAFEELEDVEELDELEEILEGEDLAACASLEETEVLEELEELDELEEIADELEPASAPVVAVATQQLRNEIEEAEFFLRQGLYDDAERVVRELQQRHGDLHELIEKLDEIDAQRQSATETGITPEVFDSMSGIKDGELLGATDFLEDAPDGENDDFSRVEPVEDKEDAQSHFDLGIAYKEMGLLDDAIAEFGKASRDPARRLDCLIMKGQCHAETGDFDRAEEAFKAALDQMTLSEEVRVALQYELGLLYETAGRLPEALEKYQIVADLDLFFRDVTDKLKSLRQALGLDEDLEESIVPRNNNRDRISFV